MYQAVSLEELAKTWNVTLTDLEAEIAAGRLRAFAVNGARRVALREAEAFITNGTGFATGTGAPAAPIRGWTIRLQPRERFEFRWPDGTLEPYDEAFEGTAADGTQQVRVRLGLGDRPAAGADRRRAVVFVNERPLVEFVGADDFDRTRLMASLLKGPDNKVVQVQDNVPDEYRHLRVGQFRSVVTGPYASWGLAVIARDDDHETMVRHALNRAGYKGLLY